MGSQPFSFSVPQNINCVVDKAGRPKWPSSKTSISKTSTTKSSTFYPKTSTGQNIEQLKNRLSKTSINIFKEFELSPGTSPLPRHIQAKIN